MDSGCGYLNQLFACFIKFRGKHLVPLLLLFFRERGVMRARQAEVSEEEWHKLAEDVTKRERDPYSIAIVLTEYVELKQE